MANCSARHTLNLYGSIIAKQYEITDRTVLRISALPGRKLKPINVTAEQGVKRLFHQRYFQGVRDSSTEDIYLSTSLKNRVSEALPQEIFYLSVSRQNRVSETFPH